MSQNCENLDSLDDYGVYPESTLYQRFKRELQKDEEGQDMHLDFLMAKFKNEFDQQMQ